MKLAFATLLCVIAQSLLAAPDTECGERVPLARLIADPDAYQDKTLWVIAYATIDFENMTACPSENDTQMKDCLWLAIDDGPYKTDQDYARYESKLKIWKRFDRHTVAIHATFDKTLKGHFSMWPAGLRNVVEVSGDQDGWNFIASGAILRKCIDQ